MGLWQEAQFVQAWKDGPSGTKNKPELSSFYTSRLNKCAFFLQLSIEACMSARLLAKLCIMSPSCCSVSWTHQLTKVIHGGLTNLSNTWYQWFIICPNDFWDYSYDSAGKRSCFYWFRKTFLPPQNSRKLQK